MNYYKITGVALASTLSVVLSTTTFAADIKAVVRPEPKAAVEQPLRDTTARLQTLREALVKAYTTNPQILAEQENLKAIDEQYSQARSGWRPKVSLQGTTGYTKENGQSSFANAKQERTPRTGAVILEQPLYRGGRTTAQEKVALEEIKRGREALKATEQQVLLDAVTAYMDVLQTAAVLKLNQKNEDVLGKNLQGTRDRFQVGEITLTDVAQAESRLARSNAETIRAMGDHTTAVASYERVIGEKPRNLASPDLAVMIPATLEEAKTIAGQESPRVLATFYGYQAAKHNVRLQQGFLLPELTLNAEANSQNDNNVLGTHQSSYQALARLTVPLYQSGAEYSRVREAEHQAARRRILALDEERNVREQVVQAWDGLKTASAQIESLSSAIKAAEVALDGVMQEALVGSRTVLDTLDAEKELLDTRVQLARAERDKIVAQYTLLGTIGRLTVTDLHLNTTAYDPIANFEDVSGKLIGFSDADTGTVETAAVSAKAAE